MARFFATIGLFLALGVHGCAGDRAATGRVPAAASEDTRPVVAELLPAAVAWYRELQERFYSRGRALNHRERQLAASLGVKETEAVRVVVLEHFPLPQDPALQAEARRYGLGTCRFFALTIGHLIAIKPRAVDDLKLLAHEFVHVAQQEEWGTEESVRRLLVQYRRFGPAAAPLEVEAQETVQELWSRSETD
ncbi:eCIS core domain-containing protein [Thiohalomonas denitrificans]|uniref:eCIS core domain-containing protein n=1 Tax=Thiohalomonas denitrificans TaxID=415747 RepID=UPI0026EE3482|nr:DUF4157 domain-containing protein [Thiohalomonas denitrificans]